MTGQAGTRPANVNPNLLPILTPGAAGPGAAADDDCQECPNRAACERRRAGINEAA